MGSNVRIPFLDLSFQTAEVAPEFVTRISQLVEGNQFIGGETIGEFESAFAHFCGSQHCIALNSGTDALRLSLSAAGLEPDQEVITSPFTFIATAEAISQTSLLRLADVESDTFTLSPNAVEETISTRTRAVVPVHIFGLPANIPALEETARKYDLFILEDACQAHGAAIEDRRTGNLGMAGAFSFYPSKNLGAFGDAGAVTCDDAAFAEKMRLLRNHGQVRSYFHVVEGFNSRMDSFQGAVLSLKLSHLERWNLERQKIADLYRDELAALEQVKFQKVPPGYTHVYHVFAILVERREELQKFLRDAGIDTRVIYPVPIHLHPAYAHLGLSKGDLPNAESISTSVLCLPIYPGLERTHVSEVAKQIRRFYGRT
ncbi:MAG: DegT/DnrJ/EryC1/StrS family aminotransferase [bacterium]